MIGWQSSRRIVLFAICILWCIVCIWLFAHTHTGDGIHQPVQQQDRQPQIQQPQHIYQSYNDSDFNERTLLWLLATPESHGSALATLLMQMGALATVDPDTRRGESELFMRGYAWASGSSAERRDVARADKAVLAATVQTGDVWFLGLGIDVYSIAESIVLDFRRRADAILFRLATAARAARLNWLLYSANGATMAPLWYTALSEAGHAAHAVCVFAYRAPAAHTRDAYYRFHDTRLDAHFWRWSWVAQELSALAVCNRTQRFIAVDADDLRRDPRAVAIEIERQLRQFGIGGMHADRVRVRRVSDTLLRELAEQRAEPPVLQVAPEQALQAAELTVMNLILGHDDAAHQGQVARVTAARAKAVEQVRTRLDLAMHNDTNELDAHSFYHAHRAAANNVVVALYTNDAFADMAMNALCSIDLVPRLREHVVVLALDPAVCYALRRYGVPCVFKEFREIARPRQLAREQLWTKKKHSSYWVLLALKMAYLRDVLASGHDVLLADADVVFFADAERLLASEARRRNVDLLIQSDARSHHNDTLDWVCAGFLFARSSPRMVAFVDEALRLMTVTGAPDQDILQLMLTGHSQWYAFNESDGSALPPTWQSAASLGVTYGVLSLRDWPNGKDLDRIPFWARAKHSRFAPQILHANMRVKDKKIPDLRRHKMWFVDEHVEGCNYTDWAQAIDHMVSGPPATKPQQ
jgi:hypothetical protein